MSIVLPQYLRVKCRPILLYAIGHIPIKSEINGKHLKRISKKNRFYSGKHDKKMKNLRLLFRQRAICFLVNLNSLHVNTSQLNTLKDVFVV